MPQKHERPGFGTGAAQECVRVGTLNALRDTTPALNLQAARIRGRWGVSWPLARVLAEIAYDTGRAAS